MNVEKFQSNVGTVLALIVLGVPLGYAAYIFFSVILFQSRMYP